MIKRLSLFGVVALAVAVSGCATKKYVSKEVGAVNQKVDTLSESVEKNQERIGRNEAENERQDGEIRKLCAVRGGTGTRGSAGSDEGEAAL